MGPTVKNDPVASILSFSDALRRANSTASSGDFATRQAFPVIFETCRASSFAATARLLAAVIAIQVSTCSASGPMTPATSLSFRRPTMANVMPVDSPDDLIKPSVLASTSAAAGLCATSINHSRPSLTSRCKRPGSDTFGKTRLISSASITPVNPATSSSANTAAALPTWKLQSL